MPCCETIKGSEIWWGDERPFQGRDEAKRARFDGGERRQLCRASTNADRSACIFRMSTRARTHANHPAVEFQAVWKQQMWQLKKCPQGDREVKWKEDISKTGSKRNIVLCWKAVVEEVIRSEQRSRIISKVKGVIQHKTGCGDWRLWHYYIINTAASSHQGSCCTRQLKVAKIYSMFSYYNASVSSDNLKVRNRTRTVLVHSFITLFDCFCKSKRSL